MPGIAGGGAQAAQGVATLPGLEQLVPMLEQLSATLDQLVGVLRQRTVSGGGPSGTSSPSDHQHGDAIDVANASRPTAEMKAYAEHMRMAGRQGALKVKYVIFNDQIANERDGWAWRPYVPKGASTPTTRHLDHVHVSFRH